MADKISRKSGSREEIPVEPPVGSVVDAEGVRASLTRLMDIYRSISETADKVAVRRCPYKDSRSRCTAKFECRNQYFVPDKPGALVICTGSDKLDYRKAWQAD